VIGSRRILVMSAVALAAGCSLDIGRLANGGGTDSGLDAATDGRPPDGGDAGDANPGDVGADAAIPLGNIMQITAGANHTCALTPDNEIYCWGANGQGQLATGDTTDSETPHAVTIPAMLVVVEVRAGGNHTCLRSALGEVYCWGSNSHGQLGDGMSANRFNPVPVGSSQNYDAIALGHAHTCAMDGTGVVCWGHNVFRETGVELGTCSTNDMVLLPSSTNAQPSTMVSAGDALTCAVTTGGQVDCWGLGHDGAWGDATAASATVSDCLPHTVRIGSVDPLVDVVRVSVGGFPDAADDMDGTDGHGAHVCAITEDADGRSIYCWGRDDLGQVGLSRTDSNVAARLGAFDDVVDVAPGGGHTCAIAGDTVYCWGRIAGGHMRDHSHPTAAIELPGRPVQLASGRAHTCVLLEGGTVYCWGANERGQSGDGGSEVSSPRLINFVAP